jgi:membrane fusion protein, heavy metal efflux system
MNTIKSIQQAGATVVAIVIATSLASLSFAGPGHDHGDEAPLATGTASPRFETHSDLFELVGIYEKDGVTLYLDRLSTNEPVIDAKIDFEAAGVKGVAATQPDGTYRVAFDALKNAKDSVAFSFTIARADETDLLAADLSFAQAHSEADGHDYGQAQRWAGLSKSTYSIAALLLLGIVALTVFYVRRKKASHKSI